MPKKKSKKSKKPQLLCAGCDAPLSSLCHAFTTVGTKQVRVCSGRSSFSGYFPKKTCARKAHEKASLCPGCGEEGTVPGTICRGCWKIIQRHSGAEEVTGYLLSEDLLGPDLYESSFNDEQPFRDLLLALCRLAAPKGSRRWVKGGLPCWAKDVLKRDGAKPHSKHTGLPAVELDRDQKEAFLSIGDLLYKVMLAQRKTGFNEGDSVLHRIMSGETSIDEINNLQIRKEKLYEDDE